MHLYEEYGAEMVHHLIGMFAFAIWDEPRVACSSRATASGSSRCTGSTTAGRFAFASEIKALLPLLPRREIDPIALSHYLTFVAVPPPRTLFAGVQKLAPASTMIVDEHGPRPPMRYWDPLEDRAPVRRRGRGLGGRGAASASSARSTAA